jgi:hypothetical protein
MPLLLLWLGNIGTWIASALAQLVGGVGQTVRAYAMRAAAVAAAAGAFWLAFNNSYNLAKAGWDAAGAAVASAAGSAGGAAGAMIMCVLPSSFPTAVSVVFAVLLNAIAVRWVRQIIFAKLA